MGVKIVADSSCDLNDELAKKIDVKKVPLTLIVDGKDMRDDESLDIDELLSLMKNAKTAPKTACPSPAEFMEAYKGEEDSVFVVTLSSRLSGTYNSAIAAKEQFIREFKNKFVHVFDSLSASVGETLISLRILELAKKNYQNMQIVEKVNEYIKEMKTLFVLDSMENLIKAGRINKFVGRLGSMLSIRLICKGSDEGTIELLDKARGAKRAFKRLIELVGEQGNRFEDRVLAIAHCNCFEKAQSLRDELMQRYKFKEAHIVEMSGLTTIYAEEGGIIIAF